MSSASPSLQRFFRPDPRRLFAGRFRLAGIVLVAFLALGTATRLGLLAFNEEAALWSPAYLLPILGIGLVFDLAAACWWLPPFALLAALWPDRPTGGRWLRVAATLLAGLTFAVLVFVAASEFVFWNEFASRFNFIAVDYLIYTREVVGNIRESYDLRPAFAAIAALTAVMTAAAWRPLARAARPAGMGWRGRLGRLAVFLVLPAVSFVAVEARYKEFTNQAQAVQLAGNGHWEFWHAFRHNEIDYEQFYRTEPLEKVYRVLRAEFERVGPVPFADGAKLPIEREVIHQGPERRMNVVLVSVESLSAEFLGAFGNKAGLTPQLDRLATEGMLFTRLYATGTRTVRGLEALTLSIPPTPGHSIVKRPDNDRLHTLGEIFEERGYESLYLYGGYGYFDNMEAFFGGNGYTVIDRTHIPKEAIHYENIWGVADEDLFTLTLDEIDKLHAQGRKVFAHVMTTSNHRPFTYPPGRVGIPPGESREGAVQYTDWAIGDFIRRAKEKPWFGDTVFVIVADHTAAGRGKTDLPVENFHIPMIVYAPGSIAPARIDTLASQIDVGPTLLALLNFSYRSNFFGHDILTEGLRHQRAFLANYQTVGYLEDDTLVELRPVRRWRLVDPNTGAEKPADDHGRQLLQEAVSYYEAASNAYRSGSLRRQSRR